MIPLSLVHQTAFVFLLEHVRALRELGVCGVLSGTLPAVPQQNVFLGLPLQLMVEDVMWLVERGHAYLVPARPLHQALCETLGPATVLEMAAAKQALKDNQAAAKAEAMDRFRLRVVELNGRQLEKRELRAQIHALETEILLPFRTDPFDVVILDHSGEAFPSYEETCEGFNTPELQTALYKQAVPAETGYAVYKPLREQGYFLAPGLRFGGRFVAYPGDPLRYHAHLIVDVADVEADLSVMKLVTNGRLATGVKKCWVVGGNRSEGPLNETLSFSVEWAGFG